MATQRTELALAEEQIRGAKAYLRGRGVLPVTFTMADGYCVRLITKIGERRVSVERMVLFAGRTQLDLLKRLERELWAAEATLALLQIEADYGCGGK